MTKQLLTALISAVIIIGATAVPASADKPEEVPEEGGTLYGHMNAEPATLNPLTSRDLYASIVNAHIFETLLERDLDTLQWKGRLADRWEISDDGLTTTFHINPKAKFSDGRPVTADDVIFTFETFMNPKIDAQRIATYFKDCDRAERVDDLTVRFVWKRPYFKSLEMSGGIEVLPKHVYQFQDPKEFNDINDKLVGSGPYLFERWTTGQELVLVRNEDYWDKKPHIKRILFRFILQEQASVQAFLSGELDEVSLAPEWYLKLKNHKDAGRKFQLFRYYPPGAGYRYIAWNNTNPIFQDKRVRLAMTHLIWREQLLKHLFHGIDQVATGPFWTESPQHDSKIKPWPFDRAEALRLLAEAGWEDHDGDGWLDRDGRRMSFELSLPGGYQQYIDIARILKTEFRRVGIDMVTRTYEWSVFVTKLDNRNYDAIILGWTGTVEGDPFQIWHSSQIEGRGSNHVGFNNEEADRLIEEARTTFDPAKRNALYHKFHLLLHEEQPYTFLWARAALTAVSGRVHGVKMHKLGLDSREWWIPKSEQRESSK